jgi:uncharacterized protein YyaL (SSP411 family)
MIDLYEASLDGRYLAMARTMADAILERFLDRDKGGFFFTSADHEQLITRSKAVFDGSTPSGNSAAVMALLRLYAYTGEVRYFAEAQRTLRLLHSFIAQQPAGSHLPEQVRGKTQVGGKLTAYVCRERTCTAPITSFEALKAELEG